MPQRFELTLDIPTTELVQPGISRHRAASDVMKGTTGRNISPGIWVEPNTGLAIIIPWQWRPEFREHDSWEE